ncbi:porin family protein [Termitidicoccus mucosus]|uniref:Uncharacterized protein n=1 Tax=Termitidicoccus mucosus TaxID=1184151 RepID=A0A178ID70_9BACT|nr:hypothetical protein AW736_24470 [Opitutaceae bacterium TSB47]
MKTTTASIRIMGALLITLGSTLAATAQTSPPTPQSVAPNYTPPKNDPKYYYQDEIQSRSRAWDFYLTVGYVFFDDVKMNNQTIYDWNPAVENYRTGNLKLDFDDSFSFGFGFAYNFNDKLSVGAEFSFSQPDYDATFYQTSGPTDDNGQTFRLSGDADVYTGNAFVQYNFMTGKFTPYVRGNVGFMYIDTGIPTGSPEYYWFWDYWWGGYDVYSSTPTQDDTYFSLGATAGLRYDFGNHVFGTLSYTADWVDTPREWSVNQRISVSVGWNY